MPDYPRFDLFGEIGKELAQQKRLERRDQPRRSLIQVCSFQQLLPLLYADLANMSVVMLSYQATLS